MALNDVCVSYLYIKDGLNFNGNPENVVLTKNCIAWKLKSKFHFVRIRKGKKEVEKISILYKGEEADLSSQYKKISLNHIYYDDTLE
jgi:hypothetical protein